MPGERHKNRRRAQRLQDPTNPDENTWFGTGKQIVDNMQWHRLHQHQLPTHRVSRRRNGQGIIVTILDSYCIRFPSNIQLTGLIIVYYGGLQ